MSDNNELDITLGVKLDPNSAKALKSELNKINQNKQDVMFGVDLDMDSSNMERKMKGMSETVKKVYKDMFDLKGVKLNDTPMELLNKKIQDVEKNIGKISKIDIKTDGFNNINKAVLEYKNSIGETIKEILKLETEMKKVSQTDGTVKKVAVPLGFKSEFNYSDNISKNENNVLREREQIYSRLSTLQREEFKLKNDLLGKEGRVKEILQEQLNLNRSNQGSIWKDTGSLGYKSIEEGNRYLSERKKLNQELNISQEKYNQKLNEEARKLADNKRLYSERKSLDLQSLMGKYKDVVPQKELQDFQNALNRINNASSMDNLQREIKETDLEFKKLLASTKANADVVGQGMGSYLGNVLSKFGIWFSVGGLFASGSTAIRDMIGFVKKLDTNLTDLSKVVDMTRQDMDRMTDSAIKLGKNLGQSSANIMAGMSEFGRVTKNLSEIEELTRVATMSANVTDLSVNESAKALNTSMINFNVSAKDSISILDGWNNIQNNFRKILCGSKIFSN